MTNACFVYNKRNGRWYSIFSPKERNNNVDEMTFPRHATLRYQQILLSVLLLLWAAKTSFVDKKENTISQPELNVSNSLKVFSFAFP